MKILSNSTLPLNDVENLSVLSNVFTVLQGDWLQIPFGDHPHARGIQRLTPATAQAMANRFHSWRGKITRMFGGLPFYVGHPDDPDFANTSKDKRAYGWTMDMEVRDDGLYIQTKWNSLGQAVIANAEYKWFSPRWAVKQIGRQADGKSIFEPQWLISDGFTNTPNIGVMPLSNEDPPSSAVADYGAAGMNATDTANQKEGDVVVKAFLIKLLGLANEATDEQIQTAANALKAKSDASQAEIGNQKSEIGNLTAALTNERTARTAKETELTQQISNQQSEIGNQKRARIELVLANAIAGGKITEAQKPQWAADLEKDLDAKLVALANAAPVVKTGSVTNGLGGRNSKAVSRQNQILVLVNEQMKTTPDYDIAWAAVKKANPALFEEPKGGGQA